MTTAYWIGPTTITFMSPLGLHSSERVWSGTLPGAHTHDSSKASGLAIPPRRVQWRIYRQSTSFFGRSNLKAG
jgi:hypothetical protein